MPILQRFGLDEAIYAGQGKQIYFNYKRRLRFMLGPIASKQTFEIWYVQVWTDAACSAESTVSWSKGILTTRGKNCGHTLSLGQRFELA